LFLHILRHYDNECYSSILKVQSAGWVTCPRDEGMVDGYALNGVMTHASRYTTVWESKPGRNIRIQHVRTHLTSQPLPGSIYGDIVISFKRPVQVVTESSALAVKASAPSSELSTGSSASVSESKSSESVAKDTVKVNTVVSVLNIAFPALADDFETRYAAWKATWFDKSMINKERYSICIVNLLCQLIRFI